VRIVLRLISTAVALAVAAWIFDGIAFTGPTSGTEEIQEKLLPLLLVAAILGLITSFVKPLLVILSFPVVILTLGLFLLVINALMLLLTDALAGALDIGFRVDGFWPALGGAIVITIVTWIVDGATGVNERDR
jgi:putative membrane protein